MRGPSTPEEAAAVTAVLLVLEQDAAAARAADARRPVHVSAWVEASRLAAQRAAMQRGSWRLSGRIGRRSRV